MAKAIKISCTSIAKFSEKKIATIATEFVKDSIRMSKVNGAIKACLKKHPELMNGEFTEVVAARILAQSVLYSIFNNEHNILWKDTATRKQMKAMRSVASDMFYICKEHKV